MIVTGTIAIDYNKWQRRTRSTTMEKSTDSRDTSSQFDIPASQHSKLLRCVVLFSIFIRYTVGLFGYSGQNVPPIYGDFEAQRHWLEVTSNLPLADWYRQTKDNDLAYWGLDYPPLTAYVSFIFGKLASWTLPSLVELHTSRGIETPEAKMFMRATVLLCDLVVFISGVVAFFRVYLPNNKWKHRIFAIAMVLLHPAFVLVDHGHFQYNCVALGLTLWAIVFFIQDRELCGAAMFCLALGFKQMSLYYAPAVFFYLVGTSLKRRNPLLRIATLGLVVVFTIGAQFLPWLTSPEALSGVFARVFPVGRGLFEDKVANFWCCTTILIKWRQIFDRKSLFLASLFCTVLSILPSGLQLVRHPTRKGLLIGLACSSFGFFMFSFQVHEKTILFPLLPITLMINDSPQLVTWIGSVATFSMFPLLEKDGQVIPYFVCQLLFILVGLFSHTLVEKAVFSGSMYDRLFHTTRRVSYLGMTAIHCVHQWFPGIGRYPDISLYLFVIFSAAHFIIVMIGMNVIQWKISISANSKKNE
eukprot:95334_1